METETRPDATNIRVSMLKTEKEMEVRKFPDESSHVTSQHLVLGQQSNSQDCLNLCFPIESQKDPVYTEFF